MQAAATPPRSVNIVLWTARVLFAILVLFLIFDSVIKIIQHPEAVGPTTQFGYAASLVATLGVIEAACLILYVIPATSVLGAIFLTGYLGGAVATQVRAEGPLFSIIFPFILGAIAWGYLYVRDEGLRALVPLRSNRS